MKFIIDLHEDIAYNILTFGRDYRRSVAATRELERNTSIVKLTGETLLGWPEYQCGQVGVIVCTIFIVPDMHRAGEWDKLGYKNYDEAALLTSRQIQLYSDLAEQNPDQFRLIRNRSDFESQLSAWQTPANYPDCTHPVGLIMSIEGAEGLRDFDQLSEWWQAGVRLIGPVWAGTRFCGGTFHPGAFTSEGYKLLREMASRKFTLDISHMSTQSVLEALDFYEGPVIASHANARALLESDPHERHLTDEAILKLADRQGIMGVLPYNKFLKSNLKSSDERVSLSLLVNQIDHICQLVGDAKHVGLGSDFDGGFGYPDVPQGIDSIADLQKLAAPLLQRGYSDQDIDAIFSGNWQRHLERTLPA